MIKLVESLKDWSTPCFSETLKRELIKLGARNLPLQEAATPGTLVVEPTIGVTVLTLREDKINITVKTGIIFSEILWAYCCDGDEPTTTNAYCELMVVINKTTASTNFKLISD